MANEHLPEDIIVQILYRLPVKPLIRFSCVSKRWSSIISDPQFAKSHFKSASERKALSQRLLLSTTSQLESFDLQTPSFLDDSSVRKLTFPFKQPGRAVKILGSCNGMVFVVARDFCDNSYIWNPSTGLLLKLPNPGFASNGVTSFTSFSGFHCGFGYVSATDDYKVLAGLFWKFDVEMYSSKANSWKRIESQPPFSSERYFTQPKGTFSNEALHWLVDPNTEDNPTIIALDLVKEKFREMPLPLLKEDDDFFSEIGVVSGCLCVASSCVSSFGEIIQLWVMIDYDVCESWTKLVKLVDYQLALYPPFVYWERSIVMFSYDMEKQSKALLKFDHKAEEKLDKVAVCSGRFRLEVGDVDMIKYDESLLWLHDYQGAQNSTQAQKKKK